MGNVDLEELIFESDPLLKEGKFMESHVRGGICKDGNEEREAQAGSAGTRQWADTEASGRDSWGVTKE